MSTGVAGAVIAGTISFFQILLAHFFYKNDKLSGTVALGLLIGFTGLLVLGLAKHGGGSGPVFSIGRCFLSVRLSSMPVPIYSHAVQLDRTAFLTLMATKCFWAVSCYVRFLVGNPGYFRSCSTCNLRSCCCIWLSSQRSGSCCGII